MTNLIEASVLDTTQIEKLCREWDENIMPIPDIEHEPHLLLSQIRKYYFEYLIKQLSINYEKNTKLLGKNTYLPSAIWRCAKTIEVNAVQACMVTNLYRKSILSAVGELKKSTRKGRLYNKLLNCLQNPAKNEKTTQTAHESSLSCQCNNTIKKRRLSSNTSDIFNKTVSVTACDENTQNNLNNNCITEKYVENTYPPQTESITYKSQMGNKTQEGTKNIEDQVMLQLEQLFHTDNNETEDNLFESSLFDTYDASQDNIKEANTNLESLLSSYNDLSQNPQTKSLDERLSFLESSGIINTQAINESQISECNKPKRNNPSHSKWLCESYYQRLYLFEKLDEIRDNNRKKYSRIKMNFLHLFNDDSEDEEMMSPLEETPDFVSSCKERIAPWIVKLLTPYYVKGRIRGKPLFKSLAKHLIKLIYQCSKYPSKYEVTSFINDFLKSHSMIRCEADFKEFKIDNF